MWLLKILKEHKWSTFVVHRLFQLHNTDGDQPLVTDVQTETREVTCLELFGEHHLAS